MKALYSSCSYSTATLEVSGPLEELFLQSSIERHILITMQAER